MARGDGVTAVLSVVWGTLSSMPTPAEYTKLVDAPPRGSVNRGKTNLHLKSVVGFYGQPRQGSQRYPLIEDGPISNQKLLAKLTTADVGPFKVYAHVEFVKVLKAAFAKLKAKHPELYALVRNSGTVNCRIVRGSDPSDLSWSNHAFGFAIDLNLGGKLDARGDDKVQQGLLDIYSVFKEFGLYWGRGFGVEDAMHFEVSEELFQKWKVEGKL